MSEQLIPLGGSSPELSGGGLFPNQIERTTKREMQGLAGRTLVTRTREQVRGVLAHEMVQELGALSVEEAAIITACPLAEARVKHIVDTLAVSYGNALLRFQ